MPAGRNWWRLVLGTTTFAMLAPGALGLVLIPFAALLVTAGPRQPRDRAIALLAGSIGIFFSVAVATDALGTALATYTLIVATAFAGSALLTPKAVLRQALRAMLWGVGGTGLLGLALRGSGFWSEVHWSAVRQASSAMRLVIQARPDAYMLFEPLVRFFGVAFPALVALQTFAGLALAWQWHVRVATAPLGQPLGPFHQFRFGDQWVWGIVTALLVWVVPKLAALKGAALNLGLVLGVFYLLRGAAIVVAVGVAAGAPVWTLVTGAVVASILVLPLLLLVPGLWTLGVFDTWLAFRQRRAGRPSAR